MDMATLFFLSSGLFLGWTLGANNMSSVFGTAIGTKMVSFKKAAFIASVFVILGAVISGQGVSETLEGLGKINTLPGAFMTALAAALTMLLMTQARIPVSATQAIVGSIVGWSIYSHTHVDLVIITEIVVSWFTSPLLAALVAFLLMMGVKTYLKAKPIPLLYQDAYTRLGLILAGAFSAYSLGANNIANVMGPFMSVVPLKPVPIGHLFVFSSDQQLFLLGAIAIAVGIYTYSHDVIKTVGNNMLKMSPIEAWVVVMAHALVLFLFSSTSLHLFLTRHGLPAVPLVPLSSAGAIIGGVVGVSLNKKGQGLKIYELFRVMRAWIWTPVLAAIICFFALFFMENVFGQQVH